MSLFNLFFSRTHVRHIPVDRELTTFHDLQSNRRFSNPKNPRIAGLHISDDDLLNGAGCLLIGAAGSGKSATINCLCASIAPDWPSKNQRMVILDCSQEIPVLFDRLFPRSVNIIQLNPLDSDGWYYDIAADADDDLIVLSMVKTMIRDHGSNTSNIYWLSNPQLLAKDVINALRFHFKSDWTFNDFVMVCTDRQLLVELLLSCPETASSADLVRPGDVGDSLFFTLKAHISQYQPAAAAWTHSAKGFSLKHFFQSSDILVLGLVDRVARAIAPIYCLLIELISDECLSSLDNGITWIVFDELAALRQPLDAFSRISSRGRKSGCILIIGAQDTSLLADSKFYGEKGFEALAANLDILILFRAGSDHTATFMSKTFGDKHIWLHSYGSSISKNTSVDHKGYRSTNDSYTSNQGVTEHIVPRYKPEVFRNLKKADPDVDQMEGFLFSSLTGGCKFVTTFKAPLGIAKPAKAECVYDARPPEVLKAVAFSPDKRVLITKTLNTTKSTASKPTPQLNPKRRSANQRP